MSASSFDGDAEPDVSNTILNEEVANFTWGPGMEGESMDKSPIL